jgi:hypothetical protein
LSEHCVFGNAEEGLDTQILLDPFEELLNLPAFFVARRDFSSFQVMRVTIFLAGFLVSIFNKTERSVDSFEPDLLVAAYSDAFPAGTLDQKFDISIFFSRVTKKTPSRSRRENHPYSLKPRSKTANDPFGRAGIFFAHLIS